MWIKLIIGAICIITGLAVHVGKFYFLVSGYNTLSEEKKANVDIRGLARLIGIFLYINGGIFLLTGVMQAAGLNPSMIPAVIFLLASSIVLVIISQRYDYNRFDENGKLEKGRIKKLYATVGVLLMSLLVMIVLTVGSSQEIKVSFLEEGLEIHGLYGDTYTWESVEDVQLLDTLPPIKARVNGSALGSKLKGSFWIEEEGTVKLYVDTELPPFIYIKTADTDVYLNLSTAHGTKSVYEKIIAR